MKLWPRFLCRRDAKGVIIEERQFATPESVPPGEGWEFITAPVQEAAPANDTAALKALQKRLDDEEATSTKLSADIAAVRKELDEEKAKTVDLETMVKTATSRAEAAEKAQQKAEAALAKATAKPKD